MSTSWHLKPRPGLGMGCAAALDVVNLAKPTRRRSHFLIDGQFVREGFDHRDLRPSRRQVEVLACRSDVG